MRYYLYRLQKEEFDKITNVDNIKIDYIPLDVTDEDLFVVFVTESLQIMGTYSKKGSELIGKKITDKDKSLRDFYNKLSIITEVGPRTYKVFAKKVKEITKKDFEEIEKRL